MNSKETEKEIMHHTLMDPAQIQELIDNDNGTITVEHFFQNPQKTAFQLSPDGSSLAFLGPYQNRMNIFVRKIGEAQAQRITDESARDIAGFFWATDDRLIFLKDDGGDENWHIHAVNRDGANETNLTPFPNVQASIIDDLEDDSEHMIVGLNKNNPQLFEPYRLNIITGELKQLAENDDPLNPISSWLTDHDGKIRAATQITGGVNARLLYRDSETEAFTTVLTTNFKDSVDPLFFTFDNKSLYAASNLGRDKTAIVKIDVESGEEKQVIFENDEYDVTGLHYSRKRKVLTTASWLSWKRQRHFFDKHVYEIYEWLQRELGNYEIMLSDTDKAEEKYIVRTYSDRSLGAYYLYDTKTNALTKLADVNENLEEDEMAEMKPVQYRSRDGLAIHGYLTIPKGKEGSKLPVVVNPHGGPWVRDAWGFNPEVQLLANRGYAVFQMNYRGSTGYGRKFWTASFKQWGKKMQDDITDGVRWLIEEGIADPAWVAIYGGSYGGYATLAGITLTPHLYRCAIDYVGVSNLFTFMNTMPPYWKPYIEMMYEMVGHPEHDKKSMEEASPVFHVDNIDVPLFIAQGAKDPRVNIDESDQIVKALRERGINVPYLVKDNEGHGFRNEENRFEFYKAMSGFLRKNLSE